MADRNALGRRDFLKKTAGATVGAMGCPCIFVSSALGNSDTVPPSERIIIGSIGVGWQGGSNMTPFLRERDFHIAAICDGDKDHLQGDVNRVNDQNKVYTAYVDYRELLGCKVRFNNQTATSLLGKSVRSPWRL